MVSRSLGDDASGATTTTTDADSGASGGGAGTQGSGSGSSSNQSAPELSTFLPDELKNDPMLVPFKSAADLAKAYRDTKSLVGANTLKKPSEHATEQDHVKFLRDALNVPGELEKYEVKLPPGVSKDDHFFTEMKKTAFELGLPPKMFEKLSQKFNEYQVSQIEGMQTRIKEREDQEWARLEQNYGKAMEQKMSLAKAVLKEFAGKDHGHYVEHLKSKGLLTDPVIAELLIRVGEYRYTEDQIKGFSKQGKFALSPPEAQRKINDIIGDREHPYHIATHPNHKKAIDEVRELYQYVAAADEAKAS